MSENNRKHYAYHSCLQFKICQLSKNKEQEEHKNENDNKDKKFPMRYGTKTTRALETIDLKLEIDAIICKSN